MECWVKHALVTSAGVCIMYTSQLVSAEMKVHNLIIGHRLITLISVVTNYKN